MKFLILSAAYLVLHLAVSVTEFRRRHRRESAIFLFHVCSFIFLSIILTGAFLYEPSETIFAGAVAGIALHAIYSMSFLELWALADGSLSLAILADVAGATRLTRENVVERFRRAGDAKKSTRLVSLLALRLAQRKNQRYCLTAPGRVLAAFFALLAASAGIQEGG